MSKNISVIDYVRQHPLITFFILAYSITWLLVAPLAFGVALPEIWHALGALGPSLAVLMIILVVDGRAGWHDLILQLRHWRVGWLWLGLAVFSPLALLLTAAIGLSLAGATLDWGKMTAVGPVWLATQLIIAVAYGLFEEPGWRGFALPCLQKRYNALVATLILAVLWAGWHVIFFFYRYAGGVAAFPGFFFCLLMGAIWLTFLYNSTKSLLVVIIWHIVWDVVNLLAQPVSNDLVMVMNLLIIPLALVVMIIGHPLRLKYVPTQPNSRNNISPKGQKQLDG